MAENEKEPKPMVRLEDFKDHMVKCADCEEDLLKLVLIRPSEKNYKLIVTCPWCEGESWLVDLVGDYFQKAPKRLRVREVEDRDGVVVTIMKRRW